MTTELNSIRIGDIEFSKYKEVHDLRWKPDGYIKNYLIEPLGSKDVPQIEISFCPNFNNLESVVVEVFFLETTNCNFGGLRYWFICQTSLGRGCGRRVGVLYEDQGMLACRRCHNLTYETQTWHFQGPAKIVRIMLDIEKKAKKLKPKIIRKIYAGKFTRKQKIYLDLSSKYWRITGANLRV